MKTPLTESQSVALARAAPAEIVVAIASAAAVQQARAAAQAVRGVVVTSQDEAAHHADMLGTIQEGRSMLAGMRAAALKPLEQQVGAIRALFEPIDTELKNAEAEAKAAAEGFLHHQRLEAERLKREEIQRRLDAEKAAAEQAQAMGQEVGPALEYVDDAAPAPPTQVKGGKAAFNETRRLACELVDFHECDPAWMKLDETAAKADFRTAERRGEVSSPAGDGRTVWRGVAFFWHRFIAGRRR